jgi:hypothetical protein
MDGKKNCCICQQTFIPDPRVKKRQKTCAAELCRKELKRRTDRAWRAQNPDYFKGRYDIMLKEWNKKNADYKKRYRLEHPEYVQKNVIYLKTYRHKKTDDPTR